PGLLRYRADAQHSGTIVDHISRIGYMAGGHSAWWTDEDMAQQFLGQAQDFVKKNKDHPFFLYYCPHNIHVPRAPNGRFLHTSECGIRGDSIEELDATVGEFLKTLKDEGLTGKTLVIFSSDNGPIFNDGYADGSIKEANGHKPAGPYRGGKYQIYEGGTRVPFIVSWPGIVAPGNSSALVNQIDLYASIADLIGAPQSTPSRPDSVDVLKALLGHSTEGRTSMVEQDFGPTLALREGPWKFVGPHKQERQDHKLMEEGDTTQGPSLAPGIALYNLEDDPHEDHDVAAQHPDIVRKMSAELDKIRAAGTTP
ncbi:MAG TPA: sulfatase-like hydrolase/transferase, partial [Candidatus Methylacidiphilales bacterium]|nr:sulfatase-like hydrolase/transferase [Candidatus Methylacidiphilales bacterium]